MHIIVLETNDFIIHAPSHKIDAALHFIKRNYPEYIPSDFDLYSPVDNEIKIGEEFTLKTKHWTWNEITKNLEIYNIFLDVKDPTFTFVIG